MREAPSLLQALNVHAGKLTYKAVAESLGVPWDRCEPPALAASCFQGSRGPSEEPIEPCWGRADGRSPS